MAVMRKVIFPLGTILKGGPGSGWFSPPDGTHLPSSAHIETVEQARDYWREHFDGKVMSLTVHTGGREIPVKVRFDADCPDAYTDSRDESGSKLEMRRFSVKRSRAMDRILSTIAHPYRRLRNWNADLLLEARKRGEHFTVVLTWREAARLYEFHSSHFKTVAEVQRLHQKQDARKNNGPLQKSEPYCAGPSVFKANYEAGVSPTGSQLRNVAPARNCAVNLPSFHEIVKAAPKLTKAHTVFLLCNDDPWSQKLLLKGLGSGERWITVHPSGKGEKGTPVLVRETKQGSGVFHVIGGAGGRLNYLKLSGLKSEKEYRQAVKERQSTKRDQAKEKREADRRAGTYAGKKAAKESVKIQAALHEQRFIQTVAGAMGWDDTTFPEDNYKDVSDAAYKKALRQHHSKQLMRAKEAADLQRKRLLADADARAAALGEVPLESDDAGILALDDFAPEPGNGGLGYATKYKERGGSEEEIQAESKEISGTEKAHEAIERQEKRKADAGAIAGELQGIKQPRPERAKLVEARAAVDILKAEKALKLVSQKAKEANKKIDEGEIQAFPLEVSEADLGDLVKKDIENELGTLTARAFLDEVGKVGNNPEKALGRHIGVGAYNSLNSVALVAGGEGLIDRDVVDVLGIAGTSQILARRLKNDLTETEYEDIKNALGDFHKARYMEMSEDAMREAREWHDLAKSIEIDAASNGHDLAAMQELNAKRRDAVNAANRILGESLGEMEANAAMVVALEQGARDQVEVSLGNLAVADAIRRARAIGLDRGDYQIHSVGSNRFLTVTGAGMDKLAMPVDRDLLASTRKAIDIIEGRHDEDNWLPMGVANRPDLAMKTPTGVAPSMAEPFAPGADLEQSIRDYIGGRTADGDAPDTIYESLNSSDFVEQAGDPEVYFAALDKVVSPKDKNGKRVRVESHKDAFEGLADRFVESRYGASRSPLHRQRFEVDQKAVDALHRALSAEPAGTLAYKPVGELHRKEQGHLRRYFYQNIGKDEKSQALRDDLSDIEGREPEKEVSDMFGVGTNPAWVDWKQRRNAKAEELGKAGLDWPKYVKMMGSPENAYSTVQDIIKSKVHKAFADAHNTLNPGNPLKVGRAQVRNNLSHLDAIDPAARERRQEEHRQRIDRLRNRIEGRYSGGAVADKIEAARQAEEAMNQAQMGLFSTDEMAEETKVLPLAADERHSLGQAAENQIASMIGIVGKNFKPNEPTRLWQASMNGRYIGQQRAVRLATENKRLILNQGVGSGKAQPLDAKILTPFGWRRMGDIRAGDLVISGDGSPTEVIGVFPQGAKPIYRVIFADGASAECCDEHLWVTQTAKERKNEARAPGHLKDRHQPKVRRLSEIRNSLMDRHIRNHVIPCAGRAQFEEQPIPVDAYLLGVLLGDGSLSIENAVRLTNPDAEVIERVKAVLPNGLHLFPEKCSQISYRITSGIRGGADRSKNPLVLALSGLGVMGLKSHEKFIPDEYLFNHEDVRVNLLRGIMDTDGTVSKLGGHVTLCTSSFRLASGITEITRSLGGIATLSEKHSPKYTHNGERRIGRKAYIITLKMPPDINPFSLPRKAELATPKTKYAPRHRIIDRVEYVGEKESQCILVSHPDHLYVTDGFLVTHNTLIGIGSFAHLHSQGKVRRGIFAVPSIVLGQFSGEALRYLEPGKLKWHIEPGASRDERIAAYKDPETHFSVVTHQALRDDLIHLGAKHAGVDEKAMAERLDGMTTEGRKAWAQEVMSREGINYDFLNVDEGHDLLNRAGKKNSSMANVLDAVSHNTPYYINASADAIAKNDPSEIFSALQKMDPDRYRDRDRFMRRYGVDTPSSREALRRELARYFYPGRIDPGVAAKHTETTVPLSDAQKTRLIALDKAVAAARIARMGGKVDVDAMKALAPSAFAHAPAERHEKIAAKLQDSAAILHQTAVRKALNEHPDGGKLVAIDNVVKEKAGKPGVIFAHSREAVKQIADRLRSQGHRVVTLTGSDSAKEKARKKLMFRPESGEPEADIFIASDAGAVGANLQRGQWLVQYDTPMTAKAQPLDAKILTPTGWTTMGEIRVGDEVIAGDGTVTIVTGVYPQGAKEIFRVRLSDGAETDCCMDHLWLTKMRHERKPGKAGSVRTLARIVETLTHAEGRGVRSNHSVPTVLPVATRSGDLPLDPYVLGVLLGNGHFAKSQVLLTTCEPEIVEFVSEECRRLRCELKQYGDRCGQFILRGTEMVNVYPARRLNKILDITRDLGLSRLLAPTKFIPEQYLFADASSRLALLQGMLDTDGTVDKRNGYVSYCTTSRDLACGVMSLARSLGGVASTGSAHKGAYVYNGEIKQGLDYLNVSVSLPSGMDCFRLRRKAELLKMKRRNGSPRMIVSVSSVGVKPAQCIMVDHPSHLYVTDDFIVTHNTWHQRNGRIHRLGQENNVELIDLVHDHRVERQDRKRLKDKSILRGVFADPIEGLDDSGLGSYLSKARMDREERQ